MMGDLSTGYMVSPASATMRAMLVVAAAKMGGVPVDGVRTAAPPFGWASPSRSVFSVKP